MEKDRFSNLKMLITPLNERSTKPAPKAVNPFGQVVSHCIWLEALLPRNHDGQELCHLAFLPKRLHAKSGNTAFLENTNDRTDKSTKLSAAILSFFLGTKKKDRIAAQKANNKLHDATDFALVMFSK